MFELAVIGFDAVVRVAFDVVPGCRNQLVDGQWARVRLSDDTVFLGMFAGGWRVVAAGCTPRGERPYDCTVAGG